MMAQTIVYQEKQKSYLIVIFIYLIIAFFILLLAFWPAIFKINELSAFLKIVLTFIAVADLVFFVCFSELRIVITADDLIFGFGFMKKSFSWPRLISATVEDFSLKNYFGYGIRAGRDKSIAFAAQGGRGVRLKIKQEKDHFFSCHNPEKIAALINEKIKS